MWGRRRFERSPTQVVDEMQDYMDRYGVRDFEFFDSTQIVKKAWILEFCRTLIERDLKVSWYVIVGTRWEAFDEEVADLLARTGCKYIGYPVESGSIDTLRRVNKKLDLKKVVPSLRIAVAARLNVKGYFVIAFPGDRHKDIWASIGMAAKMAWHGANDATFWPYIPFPGSPLFDRLASEGKLGEIDDHFFLNLMPYNKNKGLLNTRSYADQVGDRAMTLYCLLGTAIFYAVNFLRRPSRFFKLINGIRQQDTESRLGIYLVRALTKKRKLRLLAEQRDG